MEEHGGYKISTMEQKVFAKSTLIEELADRSSRVRDPFDPWKKMRKIEPTIKNVAIPRSFRNVSNCEVLELFRKEIERIPKETFQLNRRAVVSASNPET